MTKTNKMQAPASWPAIQRPQHEEHYQLAQRAMKKCGAESPMLVQKIMTNHYQLTTELETAIQLPFYVDIAMNNRLPPGWFPTGLAERIKIKVQFGKNWWELPKVHAECVFGQVMYEETIQAYYAWCWGKTKAESWQPDGHAFRTNINRYKIDFGNLVQVNIDNGRKKAIRLEDAEDPTLIDVELVNALARCKL